MQAAAPSDYAEILLPVKTFHILSISYSDATGVNLNTHFGFVVDDYPLEATIGWWAKFTIHSQF